MDFKLNKSNLGFRVYTATEFPSVGSENDICVISDIPMKNWVLSPDTPKGTPRNDGDVWIRYSVNGDATNVLKSSTMLITTLIAFQYINGEWVTKDAKSYQNASWVSWWDGTLYDAGNEYEHITGGWYGGNAAASSTASSTITKNSDHILIKNTTSASNGAITTNAIDLTKYSTLNALYKGGSVGLRVSPSFPTSSPAATNNTDGSVSVITQLTLDISELQGYYQCALSARSTSSIYLYKMWLE